MEQWQQLQQWQQGATKKITPDLEYHTTIDGEAPRLHFLLTYSFLFKLLTHILSVLRAPKYARTLRHNSTKPRDQFQLSTATSIISTRSNTPFCGNSSSSFRGRFCFECKRTSILSLERASRQAHTLQRVEAVWQRRVRPNPHALVKRTTRGNPARCSERMPSCLSGVRDLSGDRRDDCTLSRPSITTQTRTERRKEGDAI